jgi:hypothetical protein
MLETPSVSLQKNVDLREHETATLVTSSPRLVMNAKNFMEVILLFDEQIYVYKGKRLTLQPLAFLWIYSQGSLNYSAVCRRD